MILQHSRFGSLKATVSALPDSADGQVYGTIDLMRQYAVEDSKHPYVVGTAKAILARGGNVLEAVFETVRRKMRFVEDALTVRNTNYGDAENVVEVLTRPVDVEILSGIQAVEGDCDDFSMYTAALLLALADLGVPFSNIRYVTIAADAEAPKEFSHVYVVVETPDGDITLDCSHGVYAGWNAEDRASRIEYHSLKAISQSGAVALMMLFGGIWLWKRMHTAEFRNSQLGRIIT